MRKPYSFKQITLSLALIGALGASALAQAAPSGQDAGDPGYGGHGWQHGGHGGHGGAMAELRKLDLSDSQKAQIKEIVKQGFAQLKPQFQAAREQRKALAALTPDAPGYQQVAGTLAQTEASLTQARILQQASSRARIYALLSSAQKTQLASDKAQRQARFEQWKAFRAQHPLPASARSAE